jgi:lipopolysaccharide transport system ATP-binding protein
MSTVISVENLGKKYTISHQQRGDNSSLREVITNSVADFGKKILSPFSRHSPVSPSSSSQEDFWALRDVSFEVKQGDRVGIIGHNGAGKSTLLKILSRITEPTTGRVKIKGRVASLLEVGTGFHQELTGRENIYLNGAILGMSRQEINRKFDEIVAFAEIEKFLDTPVKRYSSGMYVRLAFAVAAHLEPEILIVDEVLAVGDAQFQKKCLGKMEEVGREGRTVLFVSHNMAAVRSLCAKVLWLDSGLARDIGVTGSITKDYLAQYIRAGGSKEQIKKSLESVPDDLVVRINSIDLLQCDKFTTTILNGEPVELKVSYTVIQRTAGLRIYFDLCDDDGIILIRSFNDDAADAMSVVLPGSYITCAVIPANLLAPRSYVLRVVATIYNVRSVPASGINIPIEVIRTNDINRGYPDEPIRSRLQPMIIWITEMQRNNNNEEQDK